MWHPLARLFQLETLRLCLHRFGLHLSAETGQAAFVVLYLQQNSYRTWHDFWKEKLLHNCLPRDVEVCFIVLFSNWKRTSECCFFFSASQLSSTDLTDLNKNIRHHHHHQHHRHHHHLSIVFPWFFHHHRLPSPQYADVLRQSEGIPQHLATWEIPKSMASAVINRTRKLWEIMGK